MAGDVQETTVAEFGAVEADGVGELRVERLELADVGGEVRVLKPCMVEEDTAVVDRLAAGEHGFVLELGPPENHEVREDRLAEVGPFGEDRLSEVRVAQTRAAVLGIAQRVEEAAQERAGETGALMLESRAGPDPAQVRGQLLLTQVGQAAPRRFEHTARAAGRTTDGRAVDGLLVPTPHHPPGGAHLLVARKGRPRCAYRRAGRILGAEERIGGRRPHDRPRSRSRDAFAATSRNTAHLSAPQAATGGGRDLKERLRGSARWGSLDGESKDLLHVKIM
ncbi:hypothetical protein GT030_19445 [Streptomyces sp. SID1328]|uniref:hypothetical protein n=1 Tax=Streptomyces sp. SID1328 TaxID=2690250 RepID=UPI00136DCEB3|nr:hypothetical protein [Streptomyces sp. SID1328]MYV40984.1 hypothetical protein [Streptomyces sp. SID1328]